MDLLKTPMVFVLTLMNVQMRVFVMIMKYVKILLVNSFVNVRKDFPMKVAYVLILMNVHSDNTIVLLIKNVTMKLDHTHVSRRSRKL